MLGGGGRHRIEEGARLAVAGLAPWLVVTNTRVSWPGVRASYAELMAQEALWQGVPAQAITPDGKLLGGSGFSAARRVVHVLNAPSPAATALLSIGEFIGAKVAERSES